MDATQRPLTTSSAIDPKRFGRPSSLRGVRVLVGAMTVVGLLLAGGTAVIELTTIRSRAEVNVMLDNALPSTDCLTRVSEAIGRVDSVLDRDLNALIENRPIDWSEVTAARQRINDSFAQYRSLPPYRGEQNMQAPIEDALVELDTVLVQLELAVRSRDIATAQRLENGSWRTASDAVDSGVRNLILFNIQHATDHARSLDALWQRLAALSVALAVVLLALGTLATWIAAVAVNRQVQYEEARSAELEMFAGRVAHDILSPLASTHMALRVLSKSTEPKVESAAKSAVGSLTRARQVVEGLLSFATSGGTPRRGQRTSVPMAISTARSDLEGEAQAARIALDCQVPGSCEVACGSEILGIVLANLIRNAIKFMGEAPTRRIEVVATPKEREVHFEVSDTGPGLPPGFEREAFRAYARGHDDRPGLGLGLATVKRLVEGYGGEVGVRSHPGSGALFWFTLPRIDNPGVSGTPAAA